MDLLSLKHPSFFEEQEVRMVHLLVREENSLVDPGGHTLIKPTVPPVQVNEKLSRGAPGRYVAMPIDMGAVISGVVLGPEIRCRLPRWKIA